jgi:SOS response regulatory protein OraA/RecX
VGDQDRDGYEEARARAFLLLAGRDHFAGEVARKLIGRGFARDVVERLIEELTGRGYLDDYRVGVRFAKGQLEAKARGKARIGAALASKGVDRQTIDRILGELSEKNEESQARSLAAKLLGKGRERASVYRSLLGRGFPPEIARTAVFREEE